MPLQPASLQHLSHFDACDLTIVLAIDYYDGPLNGLIRQGPDWFWFDWTGNDDAEGEVSPPRIFSLHALPSETIRTSEAWAQRSEALNDEYRLVANPHIWPISAQQRATLRSLTEIEADIQAHLQLLPRWVDLPATGWFEEAGSTFAAVQTFTLAPAQAADFERWQRDVAQALFTDDQLALDRLFTNPPVPCEPLDIFFIRHPEGSCSLRDYRGQPLADDFRMTAKHRVQCFNDLLPGKPSINPDL